MRQTFCWGWLLWKTVFPTEIPHVGPGISSHFARAWGKDVLEARIFSASWLAWTMMWAIKTTRGTWESRCHSPPSHYGRSSSSLLTDVCSLRFTWAICTFVCPNWCVLSTVHMGYLCTFVWRRESNLFFFTISFVFEFTFMSFPCFLSSNLPM